MCRWLSYIGDPVYLEKLVFEPRHSLVEQSLHAEQAKTPTNGDGFGIGWYDERKTPGLYREILPAWNDPNLRSLAHHIRSGMFFAHVRASTGTETSRTNCHPFAHENYLFMHNGQIGDYPLVRRVLEAMIDDEFYATRHGTTDSELIFCLMLTFGLRTDPHRAIRKTIEVVEREMKDRGATAPFRFTACLSNGESVCAIRHASDDKPPSLYWRKRGDHVIVVSEPLDTESDSWIAVAPNHTLHVCRDLNVCEEPTLSATGCMGAA
ncbi:glutamine amidotransferase [Thalassospira xiamenensis]|jgi:glutamine amidotransferase|uniref:class II glutamine amidotransferase n=1 Tax=Thalassospira xiamenensis TaxID=220697 RepID=UPI000DEDD7DD|nr:class II glutamine amidotransferase [Thalassospira xiamenensis]RCK32678.1 glutamine amidotransferase [Thalassospira xiamenensis]